MDGRTFRRGEGPKGLVARTLLVSAIAVRWAVIASKPLPGAMRLLRYARNDEDGFQRPRRMFEASGPLSF